MKICYSILILCLAINCGLSQSDKWKRVSIKLDQASDLQNLNDQGFDIDHYHGDIKNGISILVHEEEYTALLDLGYELEVTIPDYNTFYQEKRSQDVLPSRSKSAQYKLAEAFDYGSMGGFYTYDEVLRELDSLSLKYPNLITEKQSIGKSFEGRDIWMLKISDNPEQFEDEPRVYFDALHHSREPLSMATTINYMMWLLENYEEDPAIKYLIDNREIYFVPVVNPDGYIYNETTNPNGGGLWRKNRNSDYDDNCIGVDLNRNYAFGFAANMSCSSDNPCSNTFKGSGAFSEPETQAVRSLLDSIQPKTAFSTHSTVGTYLMPYGFDTSPPAFDIYSEWASEFLAENDYTYGVTFQMLGYTSCGTTRDYLHSEGIYGWTPEIDGSGFWPMPSEIFDLVEENVVPFLYQTWIAGSYIDIQSFETSTGILPGEEVDLFVEIKNVGLSGMAEDIEVRVLPLDPEIEIVQENTYDNLPPRQRSFGRDFFKLSINPDYKGENFDLEIVTLQSGVITDQERIRLIVGERATLVRDDFENGLDNWESSTGAWSTSDDDAFGGQFCLVDSDNGNSSNNAFSRLILKEALDFSDADTLALTLQTKHSFEGLNDFATLSYSLDNGTTWIELDVYEVNSKWTQKVYPLSFLKGENEVLFSFYIETDNRVPADGLYIDDFEIAEYWPKIVSVNQVSKQNKVSVFPNPFVEDFTVSLENNQEVEGLRIYSTNGTVVYESSTSFNGRTHLDKLNNLTPGPYVIELQLDDQLISIPIIKQ